MYARRASNLRGSSYGSRSARRMASAAASLRTARRSRFAAARARPRLRRRRRRQSSRMIKYDWLRWNPLTASTGSQTSGWINAYNISLSGSLGAGLNPSDDTFPTVSQNFGGGPCWGVGYNIPYIMACQMNYKNMASVFGTDLRVKKLVINGEITNRWDVTGDVDENAVGAGPVTWQFLVIRPSSTGMYGKRFPTIGTTGMVEPSPSPLLSATDVFVNHQNDRNLIIDPDVGRIIFRKDVYVGTRQYPTSETYLGADGQVAFVSERKPVRISIPLNTVYKYQRGRDGEAESPLQSLYPLPSSNDVLIIRVFAYGQNPNSNLFNSLSVDATRQLAAQVYGRFTCDAQYSLD